MSGLIVTSIFCFLLSLTFILLKPAFYTYDILKEMLALIGFAQLPILIIYIFLYRAFKSRKVF